MPEIARCTKFEEHQIPCYDRRVTGDPSGKTCPNYKTPGCNIQSLGGTRKCRAWVNMEIAKILAARGTCTRKQVGCVITLENRIISTGYVGAPSGMPHCMDVGCDIDQATGGCIRTSHAESGAIAFAARKGLALEGATLYTTLSPCRTCAQMIINAGIIKVFYLERYRDSSGLNLLSEAGLDLCSMKEIPEYES